MKKIIFYPDNDFIRDIIPAPKPIKPPKWFKDMPLYSNNQDSLIVKNGEANYTGKVCMPFLDSLTCGYEFVLWADLQVKSVPGSNIPTISWAFRDERLVEVSYRGDSPNNENIPVIDGFDPFYFAWKSHWGVKTPKGYSCIFAHPFNRNDLPFQTIAGIMDTDKWGIWGSQPFSLKSGFEGVIPAGTPIIQVFPFKRDEWKSEIDETSKLTDWANKENLKRGSKFRGYYKNNSWSKKQYN